MSDNDYPFETGFSPEPSGDLSSDSGNASDSSLLPSNLSMADRIETAMNKAITESPQEHDKSQDDDGKHQIGDSISPSGQAATTLSEAGGDSTLTHDDSDKPDSGETIASEGTSGLQPKGADDSTSSKQLLTPPDSWPEDRRKEFATLPDTGKQLLMSIHKDMERGLKQSFDKLATERKALSDHFGLEADQLKDLSDRYKTFQNDPVAVISQLAEEAGIDVFFNEQTQEIPEFDSQADLVRWLQKQSRNEARQAAANEAKALKDQRYQEEIKHRMEQEFAQAYQLHPDLPDHKDAVIKYISGFNLPVEMAYRLATYEGLAKLAQNGQSTKSELDKAKSELEKLQKLATMPPGRADGRSHKQRSNGLDMFEAAYNSAEKAIGRQS